MYMCICTCTYMYMTYPIHQPTDPITNYTTTYKPHSEAAFAFTVWCGMLKDCASFREAVNAAMTVADLRRALLIHQVCLCIFVYMGMHITTTIHRCTNHPQPHTYSHIHTPNDRPPTVADRHGGGGGRGGPQQQRVGGRPHARGGLGPHRVLGGGDAADGGPHHAPPREGERVVGVWCLDRYPHT
jgi:hypothetical protein